MRRFTATLEGVTPFLFNRYLDPLEIEKTIGKQPKDLSKQDEWRKREGMLRLYQNGNGAFLPSRNIRSAMVEGAKATMMKHKPPKGAAISLWPFLRRGLVTEPLELEFGIPAIDFTDISLDFEDGALSLHGDMVRVPPRTGALVRKYWAKLEEWRLTATLAVFDESLQEEDELRASLEAAGVFCGLGTGRPDYGKFKVIEWAEQAA